MEGTLQSSTTDNVMSFGWKAALDIAMQASMIGLDQQNDDTNDDILSNNGAVVIFNAKSCTMVGTSSSRRAINSIIIEESYNRCRRNLRLSSD
jgi:hypothetical protein